MEETPGLLADRLDGESVGTLLPLGDDVVAVTPTRTLVYRAEGLLREESVEAFPHEADRVECDVGRRKATVRLAYLDGAREFGLPADRLDEVLEPLLEGVLVAAGVAAADESVRAVYRFSELALVVTDRRLVKHVGTALWDGDAESYPFEDVTGLTVEEGTVAAELVLTVDGRPQRIKAPADRAPAVRRTVETALLEFHGVGSLAALAPEEVDATDRIDARSAVVGEEGRGIGSLLDAEDDEGASVPGSDPPAPEPDGDAETGAGGGGVGLDAADDPEDVHARLDALAAAVERQNDLLERQGATIERLVAELRRGR